MADTFRGAACVAPSDCSANNRAGEVPIAHQLFVHAPLIRISAAAVGRRLAAGCWMPTADCRPLDSDGERDLRA